MKSEMCSRGDLSVSRFSERRWPVKVMTDSLEKLGDVVSGTFRPFPWKGVIVQHPRHYVMHSGTILIGCTFHVIVVGHVQSKMQVDF